MASPLTMSEKSIITWGDYMRDVEVLGYTARKDAFVFITEDTYRGERRLNIFGHGMVKNNTGLLRMADSDGQSVIQEVSSQICNTTNFFTSKGLNR